MLLYIYIIVAILSITLETYKMQFNNKMRYRRACGFTLAEILITLMILGFVGAMGVPMLTQQRDKRPLDIIENHGTVECYYDEEGQLKAWVSNNSDDKEGHFDDDLIVNTEYGRGCKFTAPLANSYVIQAIGAGGMGAKNPIRNLIPTYKSSTDEISGKVSLEYKKFKDSIMSVDTPNWVRKYWKYAWYEKTSNGHWKLNGNRVKYTVTGAVGAGGRAECATYINKQISTCLEDPVTNTYPEECYELYCGPGGESAPALRLRVAAILNCHIKSESEGKPSDVDSLSEFVFTPMYLAGLAYDGHAFNIVDVNPNATEASNDDVNLNYKQWQENSMFLAMSRKGNDGYLRQSPTASMPTEIKGAEVEKQRVIHSYSGLYSDIYIPTNYFRYYDKAVVSNDELNQDSKPVVYHYLGANKYTDVNNGATKEDNLTKATGFINGQSPKVATLSLDPSSATELNYSTKQLAINAIFGLAGVPGSVGLRILEKLPIDTEMLLIPAKGNTGDDKDVVSRVYVKYGDTYMLVTQGSSGADGFSAITLAVPAGHIPVGPGDLPFPAKYYPEAFKSKSPYYSIATSSGYNSALLSAFKNSGFVPGKSGAGTHPIIKKVEVGGDTNYYFKFGNNSKFVVGDEYHLDKLESDDETCFDKSVPKRTRFGLYCGEWNTKANPGAVLLSW